MLVDTAARGHLPKPIPFVWIDLSNVAHPCGWGVIIEDNELTHQIPMMMFPFLQLHGQQGFVAWAGQTSLISVTGRQ